MTPELQDALVAMIQSGQQELPAVLAEVLLKKTIAAWAFIATGAAIFIAGLYAMLTSEDDTVVVGGAIAGLGGIVFTISLYNLVTIYFTPKAVLLDYIVSLVR